MIDKALVQTPYNVATDAYSSYNTSPKIRGTLIENNEDNVKIDVGDNKIIEAKLKEPIEGKVGDVVVIDKKNIISSKTVEVPSDIKIESGAEDKLIDTLKYLSLDVNVENLSAVKSLRMYGVPVTKENIQSYIYSKNYLTNVVNNLDYDSAIKILDKGIDIENESLQKIANAIEEVKNEKEGFSFSKLFNKKELTTEDAESIAEKIYGNKMGKDTTDIIKALYKKDMSITKKNIERVNDVFYKLDKLQDVDDKTFVDTVKNNVDPSIDNLYKIKNYIKSGAIQAFDKISSVSAKMYESFLPKVNKVTEKDLKLMENDIKDILQNMDVKSNDENIKLAKEFIKNNLDVSKENIQNITDMKDALSEVIKNLDKDSAIALIKSGLDIEKMDIRDLKQKLNEIKNNENDVSIENKDLEADDKNLQKDVKEILDKVDKFKQINDKDLLTLLKKNVDFKIDKVDQVIFKSKEDIGFDEMKNSNYNINQINVENNIKDTLQKLDIPSNDENIKIAKELVKNDMKITNENMDIVKESNKAAEDALKKVNNKELINIGIDIANKESVEIGKNTSEENNIKNILQQGNIEVNDENIKIAKALIKNNITVNKENVDIVNNISELAKGALSKEENNDNVLALMKIGVNMLNEEGSSDLLDASINKIDAISKMFSNIKNLDFNTIAFQLRNKIPMTLKNLESSYSMVNQKNNSINNNIDKNIEMPKKINSANEQIVSKYVNQNLDAFEVQKDDSKGIQKAIQAAKALIQNSLNISKTNIQRIYEAYGQYKNVRENLSSNMVKDSVKNNLNIEEMNIKDVSKYVDNFKITNDKINTNKNNSNINNYMKDFTENIKDINKEKEMAIALLMKNDRPISLKEIERTSSLLKNKNQLGHHIADIVNSLENNKNENIRESVSNLKRISKTISKNLKEGNIKIDKAYDDIADAIKEVKNVVKVNDEEANKILSKKYEDLSDILDLNKSITKEEKMLQLPLYMNEQFGNLNMYFKDGKKGNKKLDAEDMDVVLSLDTANMGNINIRLGVNKKEINVQMDVNSSEDKAHIQKYKETLQTLFEGIGYKLGEISFDSDESKNMIEISKNENKENINRGFLDVKI